ncbi:MAG: radical SAM protein [Bacteroidota bacterium]|nr:radical SAM protein [Bacteroidota bacterium]
MKLLYLKIQLLIVPIRYLSIPKIINGLKLVNSYLLSFFKIQKRKNIYPFFISIETTNFCNLRCPECPVGKSNALKTEKTFFNCTLYTKLLAELGPTLHHVILYFQGEPFLNKQLFQLIKQTHEANIYSSTSTNGQFLNEKVAREIIISGLDKLIVSIDGSTQQVYETYRVGGNLQKAIDGIKQLVQCKKELKSITPFIEIQFLVLKTNEHQMKEMQNLAKTLQVDRLTFKTAQLYDFENGNELLTTKKRYARYKEGKDGKFKIKGHQNNRCWRLWSGAVVNVQGDVLPCCFDKSSAYSFGNIVDNSFLDCWQNNKAFDFRSRILRDRKLFDMCRNCTNN